MANSPDITICHLTDTLETLRGNVRYNTRINVDMLKDSLSALDKGKTDVVKDYIERVIESLNSLTDKTR